MVKLFKSIINSKLAKNGFWMLVLQTFNTLIPLLTVPYITRILSKPVYGDFSLVLSYITYFQVFVEFGFGLSGARKAATRDDDKTLSKVRSNILTARFFLLLVSAIPLLLILLLGQMTIEMKVCMLLLFVMVIAVAFQQTWFFQGIAQMKNITIINVISRTVSVVLIFVFVKTPSDIYLYCLFYILNFVISSILGNLIVRKKYKVAFHYPRMHDVWIEIKDGFPLFISTAMGRIFGSIGITILGFFAVNSIVGSYSAINKIPYVLSIMFAAISQAIYPFSCQKFNESYRNGIKFVSKIGSFVILSFLIPSIFIVLFRDPIVSIAFGEDYVSDSFLLFPFIVWIMASILNNFLGIQILVASGKQKVYSVIFTVCILTMVGLMFWLGSQYQSIGIAVASMASELLLTVILLASIIVLSSKHNRGNDSKTDLKSFLKSHRFFYAIYYGLMSFAINVLKLFVKPDKRMVLFVSFGGRKVTDSPKAIYDAMKKDPRFKDYRLIWAVIDVQKYKGVLDNVIKIDTLRYFITALKARCWITNVLIERSLNFKGKNTFYLYTGHGSPIKIGGADLKKNTSFKSLSKLKYDIVLAQSEFEREVRARALGIPVNQVLLTGSPTNDILTSYTENYKNDVRKALGLPSNKKVILYAPTFREYKSVGSFDSPQMNFDLWEEKLSDEYCLLYRAHPITEMKSDKEDNFVFDVSNYESIEDLMIAADILVSDYSGLIPDFSITLKPIFLWTYDYEDYCSNRGLYFDIRQYFPNASTEEELIGLIKESNFDEITERVMKFRNLYATYRGNATKNVLDIIFDKIN